MLYYAAEQAVVRVPLSIMRLSFRFWRKVRGSLPISSLYYASEFSHEKVIESYLFYVSFKINIGLKFNQKKDYSLGSK